MPRTWPSLGVALSSLVAWLVPGGAGQAVFSHYLVGTVDSSTNHANQDIQDAMNLGFDAFALNLGAPTASWAIDTVSQLFQNAEGTPFKLFFSLDLSQDGSLNDFTSIVNQYLTHPNYYSGANGKPFLSTFDSGSNSQQTVSDFLGTLTSQVYFVPDFDDVSGYYTDPTGFISTWTDVIDGVFSWETAWPSAQSTPQNTSTQQDIYVQSAASAQQKSYMIGLSSLQYKHLPNANYYRVGEVNLPQRMEEILAMDTPPTYVEVITWNDSGESHYIGNLWPEGIPGDQLAYANQTNWDHSAWQSLVSSFIVAYKAKVDASQMAPAGNQPLAAAMWYRTLPVNAACADDPMGKPQGWQAGLDAVNVAAVLPSNAAGYTLTVTSNGAQIASVGLSSGLNYFSFPGLQVGDQSATICDGSNNCYSASGGLPVYSDDDASPGICNFNYQVVNFAGN